MTGRFILQIQIEKSEVVGEVGHDAVRMDLVAIGTFEAQASLGGLRELSVDTQGDRADVRKQDALYKTIGRECKVLLR